MAGGYLGEFGVQMNLIIIYILTILYLFINFLVFLLPIPVVMDIQLFQKRLTHGNGGRYLAQGVEDEWFHVVEFYFRQKLGVPVMR